MKSWYKKVRSFLKKLNRLQSAMIIIFGLFIILYVIYIYLEKRKEHKEPDDLKFLKHRRNRFKELVGRKKRIKKILDFTFKILYPFSRITIVAIWVAYTYSIKFFKNNPQFGDYVDWNEAGIMVLGAIFFIIYGNPLDLVKTIKKLKPVLETYIYGKYLGIDNAIEINERELEKIESKIQKHPYNSEDKKNTS